MLRSVREDPAVLALHVGLPQQLWLVHPVDVLPCERLCAHQEARPPFAVRVRRFGPTAATAAAAAAAGTPRRSVGPLRPGG